MEEIWDLTRLQTYNITLIPLCLFNGSTNSVIQNAINLPVCFPEGEKHSVMFFITPLDSSCLAVLGHNWLICYNPLIDWALSSIMFGSPTPAESMVPPELATTVLNLQLRLRSLCPKLPWLTQQHLPASPNWMAHKPSNSSFQHLTKQTLTMLRST